jgi:protocatechuate 3,4-dioxygenase beta subunit
MTFSNTINTMKYLILFLLSNLCFAQNSIVGGGCDGCELMYVNMPIDIPNISKSPGWDTKGQKLLITGTIYQIDGKTPADNVIVYYWQTDNNGYYSSLKNLDYRAKRHGYIRGWVKSDSKGHYQIYTIRPGAYPNSNEPAHIHLSVKEPDIKDEYYTDALIFDDDRLLTSTYRQKLENRGGSGVLRTLTKDSMQLAEHNIILGLNIPNYPKSQDHSIDSGQKIGEDFHSITPYHAWGNDIDTTTCPVCRYGRYFGILYFINNIESVETEKWLVFLEELSEKWGTHLKVYMVFGNAQSYGINQSKMALKNLGEKLKLKHLALTFVPSFNDHGSDIYLAKINPEVNNTFIVYKNRKIIEKSINMQAKQDNFDKLSALLNQHNSYFELKESWKK